MAAWKKIGDVDNNNKIDKQDITILTNIVLGVIENPLDITFIDISKDKKVDIADVVSLIAVMKGDKEATEIYVPETVPIGNDKGGFD